MKLTWNEGKPTVIELDDDEHKLAVYVAMFIAHLFRKMKADTSEIRPIIRRMKKYSKAKEEKEKLKLMMRQLH